MSKQFQSRTDLLKEIEHLKNQLNKLVAERKNQKNLQTTNSDQQYRYLFEQAGDSIFIVDAQTLQIINANQNAARRLGYSLDELRHLRFSDIEISEPEELNNSEAFSWQSTISGLFVYESVHCRKDGSTMPVEVSSSIIFIEGQQLIQNVVRDLTKRKLIEQRNLEILLEQERVDLLSNFIQKASHEFRTPLSVIGTNSFIIAKSDDEEKRQVYASRIHNQVDQISNMVDGLLRVCTLARQESIPLSRIDTTNLISQILDNLHSQTSDLSIEVTTQIEDSLPTIAGNVEYLSMAFDQIFDNAIKHIEGTGQITIRADMVNQMIVIEVEDDGHGIEPDDLPHIFDTFYRADQSGTTRGLGLGLTIVRMIVDIHQGEIEVESEPESGSVFRIILPTTLG